MFGPISISRAKALIDEVVITDIAISLLSSISGFCERLVSEQLFS